MAKSTSLRQAGRHIADGLDADPDCMVTPCPLCHLNLDMQQYDASKDVERELGLPVLHFPQMIGLALGPEPKQLGRNRHVLNRTDLQRKIARRPAADRLRHLLEYLVRLRARDDDAV